MDYPETRTVKWIEDSDGTIVGQCEYIRKDIYDAAKEEIIRLKAALDHQRHETGKRQSQIDRLTQQNADMAAWINAQCGGV